MSTAGRGTRGRAAATGVRIGVGLLVPSAVYYLARALGGSIYLALIVSAVLSALPAVVTLIRHRRVDGLSLYFTVMTLGSLVVALVPGSTRFLLAREAILTGVTGIWFVVSAGTARPLAYQFSRPLIEGRFRWPDRWDSLWPRSPAFRRMWRNSSLVFGGGLLLDAGLRVVLAYTMPPDLVPALALGLYVVTMVVLNVIVTVYYVRCRVYDPSSPLRRGEPQREVETA